MQAAKAGDSQYNLEAYEKAVKSTRKKLAEANNETIMHSVPYALCAIKKRQDKLIGSIYVIKDAAELTTNESGTAPNMRLFESNYNDNKLNTRDASEEYYQELSEALQSAQRHKNALKKLVGKQTDTTAKLHYLRLLQAFIEFNMYGAGALKDDFRRKYYNDWRFDPSRSEKYDCVFRLNEQQKKDRTFSGRIELLQEIYKALQPH